MPAPDVCYFFDASLECGHIAPDVHHHFMNVARHEDANAVVDNYDTVAKKRYDRHWDNLIAMGLHCEDTYLRWRAQNREAARVSSLHAAYWLSGYARHRAKDAAQWLVDKGATNLTPATLIKAEREMGLTTMRGVIRRSIGRALADLSDLTPYELGTVYFQLEGHRDAREMFTREELNGTIDSAEALRYLNQKRKKQRGVIKRSLKLAQRVLGTDQTRLFVGKGKLRIEGRLANYELTRSGSLAISHGGATLAVFDKEHDIHLCNLCIYTPNVPVLDHVASIVLHIRADEEEEILKIGNAYNIAKVAHERDWLVPYLPKPVVRDDAVRLSELAEELSLEEVEPRRVIPWPSGYKPVQNREAKIAVLEPQVLAFFGVEPLVQRLDSLPYTPAVRTDMANLRARALPYEETA